MGLCVSVGMERYNDFLASVRYHGHLKQNQNEQKQLVKVLSKCLDLGFLPQPEALHLPFPVGQGEGGSQPVTAQDTLAVLSGVLAPCRDVALLCEGVQAGISTS